MDILERLVKTRKERKIDQKKVAKHLGITPLTLSRYETGKRKMPYDTLIKYAEYLDFEIRMLTV